MNKKNSFWQQYGTAFILLIVIAILAAVLTLVLLSHPKGKKAGTNGAEGSNSAGASQEISSGEDGERKWSVTHLALPHAFEKATFFGDQIYGCYYGNGAIQISVCDRTTGKEVEKYEIPEFGEIQGIMADGAGVVYLVTQMDGQGTIWRISSDGTVQKSETEVAMSGIDYRILLICSDNSGRH